MKPKTALKTLRERLARNGIKKKDLRADSAVEAMLSFYADERADRCPIDEDGDMLLYQWGVNDWDGDEAFEVDITRQLMIQDVDEPYQLHLTLKYPVAAPLKKIEDGNQWCNSPAGLDAFREFIQKSPAYLAIKDAVPSKVELRFEQC